ncbi:MAG: hypothetical protein Q8O42_09515 [Acidobacteriota bacterium]|nr:hypothetical protein [Acidobacteriota bacterium]
MPNLVYNVGKEKIANGAIDLDTSTIKVMLVQSTYTVDADHGAIDDGTAADPASHEISVSGYSRQTLATRTVTKDNTNDRAYLDADDATFAALAAGQTIGGAIIFIDSGADNTSYPIAFFDLTDTPTNGGNIVVQWAAGASGGILTLA